MQTIVGRPYMLDLFAAGLTTCVHLLRYDAEVDFTYEGPLPSRQIVSVP